MQNSTTKKVIFLCNKLGRDKDLENFKAQGIVPKYRMLSGDEWHAELQRKLIEEVSEVSEAKDVEEITDELADILIVIGGLCKAHGISLEDLERVKQKKHVQRGGFE
jgi:predicted house-cleaning noncanonical NTP pyrophosphatase (MazG superfamily)